MCTVIIYVNYRGSVNNSITSKSSRIACLKYISVLEYSQGPSTSVIKNLNALQ